MKHPLIHSVTIFLILMTLTFSSVGVTPAYAATFTVTTTNNNGTGSLRQAITDAPSGSTITFDPSLSGMSIYLASTLTLSKNIIINGSALASKITVSGDTNGDGFGDLRVFSVVNGVNATLDGLIITRGDLAGVGGAIFNAGILTVTNSYIHGNSGSDGGSIFNNSGSSLTVTNSIFSYNVATHFGGAIYNNGALVATNTTFSHNGGISGGAIYNNLGTLTLIKNTLSFNSALDGGGIFNSNSMLVTNSLFDSNIAQQSGGGIRNTGNLIMMNSTLSQNTAFGTGGGIDSEGTVSVRASTITGNSALAAGGIYNSGGLTLINSTLIENSADLDGGAVFNNGVANVYNSSIIFNGADADADASGGSAGGVYNSDANGAVFNLRNTMVSGNHLRGSPIYNDCTGTINAYGRNLIGALSVVNEGACTVHLWSGSWEPLIDLNTLGVLQNNGGLTTTVALLPGSNAIDQGDLALGCIGPDALPLATDQRGLPRVVGVNCDIGAYEYSEPIFLDVPYSYSVNSYIERLYNAGITGGCSLIPLMYCPENTVTRAQMAVFLLRGIHGSAYIPPVVGVGTGFADVPANHPVAAWIKQLAAEGITGGCGNGNYCPDATVTRAQMAVFLLRSKYTSVYTPPPANGDFTDVPVDYSVAAWIEQLAAEGITGGCGEGIYCPAGNVTRAQMAVFLVRTFNLP